MRALDMGVKIRDEREGKGKETEVKKTSYTLEIDFEDVQFLSQRSYGFPVGTCKL